MKRKRFSAILGCILTLAILAGIAIPLASAAPVTLTFLNPFGEVMPPANQPLVDRPDALDAKTVKLIHYGAGTTVSALSVAALGELLQADYPTMTTVDVQISGTMYDAKPASTYDDWASGADAVILGVVEDNVGAWWISRHAKELEARGVPVVVVTNSWWDSAVECGAQDNGFAAMRIVSIDKGAYADANGKATASSVRATYLKEQMTTLDVYSKVKSALTDAPTDAEKSSDPLDPAIFGDASDSIPVSGLDYADAMQKFHDLSMDMGFGDGLPMDIPTSEAVNALLDTVDREPDEILGKIMLRGGLITVEKVAINAVMAGARPEHFPIILAAMEAYATAWEDNKLFYQPTMANEQATLMLVVSGPAVDELDVGNGRAFDPGSEGEGVIGRAVRLCARNIGHISQKNSTIINAFYRINDHEMYVVGENNKYLPEGWKTHSEMMGFPAGSNTVTLLCITRGQLIAGSGGGTATATAFLNSQRNSANTAANAGAPGIYAINFTQAEMAARELNDAGGMGLATKEEVQAYIANNVGNRTSLVWPIVAGFGRSMGGRAFHGTATYNTRGFQTQLAADNGNATAPSAPQNFDFKVNGAGTAVTLSWSAPVRGDVAKYQVSKDDGATWVDAGLDTSYTFDGLTPGAQYFFWVRAISDLRNSADIGLRIPGLAVSDTNPYEVKYTASGRGAWAGEAVTPERTPPETMKIDAAALSTLRKGATTQLAVTVVPVDADPTVVWSSTNPAIASVDENGLVKAMAIGTAVITAKTVDGVITSTVTIRVIA